MKRRPGYRRVRFLLYLMLLTAGCVAISYAVPIHVIEVEENGPVFRVSQGEVFALTYTHSMYHVSVTEKFRVKNSQFILFHVKSSDAALEYFGIGTKEENNVYRSLTEFVIPCASIGKHVLHIKNRKIELSRVQPADGKIRVRLRQMPFIMYASQMWR